MKAKTRPHSRTPPVDRVERRTFVRERDRQAQEAALMAVDCRSCGQELAVVLPGAEAYCRPCGVWTSTLPGSTRGVLS